MKGNEIPKRWAKKLHIDPDSDADRLFDIIVKPVDKSPKKASLDELKAMAKRLRELPDLGPNFTEDDLYDEYGLPK